MRPIWYTVDGMLDYAGTVAKREEMPDPHLRYDGALAREADRIDRRRTSGSDVCVCGFENREIPLGGLHPGHRAARPISAFAHGVTPNIVCQKAGDLGA